VSKPCTHSEQTFLYETQFNLREQLVSAAIGVKLNIFLEGMNTMEVGMQFVKVFSIKLLSTVKSGFGWTGNKLLANLIANSLSNCCLVDVNCLQWTLWSVTV
jgi:hypothetical protein